jgi:hypothetical protein
MESTPITSGWLYVLSNPTMPGLCKVGKTTLPPPERAANLTTSSGVPAPFVVEFARYVQDYSMKERALHDVLDAAYGRPNPSREFFSCTPAQVRMFLSLMDGPWFDTAVAFAAAAGGRGGGGRRSGGGSGGSGGGSGDHATHSPAGASGATPPSSNPQRKTGGHWTQKEDQKLRCGVAAYGEGHWCKIWEMCNFIATLRIPKDLKDRWRILGPREAALASVGVAAGAAVDASTGTTCAMADDDDAMDDSGDVVE